VIIDLIDGTCELFRHFHGLRRFTKGEDRPSGAVLGVLDRARRRAAVAGRALAAQATAQGRS
jgi:hypothetical protein